MTHPSLGAPPPSRTAGFPDAADRIRVHQDRLAGQALRVAMNADRTLAERYDETGLRQLLRDTALLLERVGICVEEGDVQPAHDYAEWTAPTYRRRRVPMDDLITLCEGIRSVLPSILAPGELPAASEALDAAIATYKWHRRLAGDARKRNPLLQWLYKGA
jgi:hypothetical protein